ncbi:MAG TPA: hypothetical protein VLW54_14360 [Candidatus Acidoferrales bacterium]|nr:hypothetical protein [Candidatus Acidoferrales bacterium]
MKNVTRLSVAFSLGIAVAACAFMLAPGSLAAQTPPPPSVSTKEPPPKPKPTIKASAILIEPVDPGDVLMPPDFQVAVYEYLVEQVTRTKKFAHVYRSGDKEAANVPDLVTLRTKAEYFKMGSEKKREVTTVAGSTKIRLKLLITNHEGKVLADPDVEGSVHFFGGNLNAAYDFAKNVAEVIRGIFI